MTAEIIACITAILCVVTVCGAVLAGMAMTHARDARKEEAERIERLEQDRIRLEQSKRYSAFG